MRLAIGADIRDAAVRAADITAARARAAITARGRFLLGLSGGRGPAPFFEELARRDLDWSAVWICQVDERVAPDGDDARNVQLIHRAFAPVLGRLGGLVPVPVDPDDAEGTVATYRRELMELGGSEPVLDVVHLGLGPDGHTASLVPGDPVVDELVEPVGLTGPYQGHRRVTLTRPVLDAARFRLWFVTGDDKRQPLARLLRHDASIPAGLLRSDHATVVADRAAVGLDLPTAGSKREAGS